MGMRVTTTEFRNVIKESKMKKLDVVAAVLLVIGGLNWGLVGAAHSL